MAIPRYGGRRFGGRQFGLSFIEASLALSVIVGLLFVTVRIMAMPELSAPPVASQADPDLARVATPTLAQQGTGPRIP